MDFSNVIRMWNYLDNLLDWYDDFNEMRNFFFNKYNVFDNFAPGGAGIGVSNPTQSAYIGELFAIKPIDCKIKIAAVPSPLQCSAIDSEYLTSENAY